MSQRIWGPVLLIAALCLTSAAANAQTGLGGIGPSKGEIVGIAVGAAAGIALVVYLVIPKQKTIEGCVESADGGMRLTDEKDKRTYLLVTDKVSLQPGERVALKGKKSKDKSGTRQFRVRKLLKDQGTCKQQTLLRKTWIPET
jgi:hypothetical protein